MTFDPNSYTISIRRETVDGDLLYVGHVAEFPNLQAFEDTFEEARSILIDAIQTLYLVAEESGQSMPSPRTDETEFSGRITLRMPKSLHRQVAAQAQLDDVSLNQYLLSAIAQQIGHTQMLSAISAPLRTSSESNVLNFRPILKKSVSTEVING